MELLDAMRQAHEAEVAALRRRIKVLERERDYFDVACSITYSFMVRRTDLLPDYIRFIYGEHDRIRELCPDAKPQDFAATFYDDVDLAAIPETGDDFKRRRR